MKNIIELISFVCILNINVIAQNNIESLNKSYSDRNVISSTLFAVDLKERVLTTSVIVAELAILFMVLYYWRKTKNDSINGSKLLLKKNIKAIRNERINPNSIDTKFKERKSIYTGIKLNLLTNQNLTDIAKKSAIAKGELQLLVRIRQIQKNNL